jgi:NAD(P)-dependent dehydrogenase (short-subunit alcohol dehydrogenase family)
MQGFSAMRLQDRTAIVTGAGSGIGAAIARRFAAEGAWVACVDRNESAAAATAADIGGYALSVLADVSDEAAVVELMNTVLARRGVIDVLVNNAGIAGPQEPAASTPLEGWNATIAVNLTGTFLVCKHAVPHLIKSRGCIVNVASALAFIGWPRECAYGPTKAGVVQLTKSMALDYAPHVRVNCVCPGAVRTAMIESVLPPGDSEALLAEYGKVHPLHGRLADPDEIARPVLFLASDDASLITGAALVVDAGFSVG